ncbi:MAG: hypothetical protein IPO19_03160 [Rhodoferax sp.]|nr:hypothetical protein [Rhodoferax sp.]MBK9235101.1 hypothetical protein [Rhodoferax sp.]
MDSAFYVFPLHGGSHLFASNILSECVDFVAHRAHVSIVDMFGQVWLTV